MAVKENKTRKSASKSRGSSKGKVKRTGRRASSSNNSPAPATSADLASDGSPVATASAEPAVSGVRFPQCPAGKLAVVYITDGNKGDCARLTWAVRSLARHSGFAYDTFVLLPGQADGRPDLEHDAPEVLEHGSVSYLTDMEKILASIPILPGGWNRQWPFVVLYRLGIPLHPAFAGYDRVLYVDTDTLVLSSRVDVFLASDLAGYEIGGVVDTVQEEHDHIRRCLDVDLRHDFGRVIRDRYGDVLKLRPYINAGVILWNIPEIRKDVQWYRERLSMFWEAECRGLYYFLDQDFINSMMVTSARASMIYNWFTRSGVEPDCCVIRHYCGKQYGMMRDRALSIGLISPEEADWAKSNM